MIPVDRDEMTILWKLFKPIHIIKRMIHQHVITGNVILFPKIASALFICPFLSGKSQKIKSKQNRFLWLDKTLYTFC